MTGGMGNDAPRLPPKPAYDPQVEQLHLDLLAEAAPRAPQLDLDWPPFEDPELLSLTAARRLLVAAHVLVFGWAAAVVVTALVARRDMNADRQVDSSMATVGRLGIAAVLVVCLCGWYWTDRATRNVHRLGGRLPTRIRCVSAWAFPLVVAGVLAATVVRLEPNQDFDYRPAIIVVVIAVATWRPFALIRRILATVSRMREDTLIGVAYVLELSGFGLLWWQLTTWPDDTASVDSHAIDLMIAVGTAAALALGASVVVWIILTRDVAGAQAHRLLANRTRHDHSQLRLRGINPMDPEVRWALLRIRQSEEIERQAQAAPERPRAELAPTPATVAVEPAIEESVSEPTVSVASSDDVDAVVEPAEARTADVAAEPDIADVEVEQQEDVVAADVDDDLVDVSDDVADDVTDEPVEPAEEPAEEPADPAADEPPVPPLAAESTTEFASRLRARLRSEHNEPAQTVAPLPATPATQPIYASRLAQRLESPERQDVDPARALPAAKTSEQARVERPNIEPIDTSQLSARPRVHDGGRLADRLGDEPPGADRQRNLLELLEDYGITPNPAGASGVALAEATAMHDEERWLPPRLFWLEAVRYLLLLALIGVAATSGWIVFRSATIGDRLSNGDIAAVDVERLDVARRAFIASLGIMLALVAIWVALVTAYARRAGMTNARRVVASLLAVGAVALCLVSFVLDGTTRDTLSSACVVGSLVAAVLAVVLVTRVAQWFGHSRTALAILATGLPVLVGLSWIGGLQRPIESGDAIELITFFAATQTIAAGVLVVVTAIATADLEEAVRLAPGLAVAVRPGPRPEATIPPS